MTKYKTRYLVELDYNSDPKAEGLKRIVGSSYFDYGILVLIFISSIVLAMETPLIDPNGKMAKVLYYIDVVTTGFFVLEIILKMFAYGIICNGPKSYLRSYGNIADVIIILICVRILSLFYRLYL